MKKSVITLLLFINGLGYYSHFIGSNLHFHYYDAMQQAFGLTNTQIGLYGSIYGAVAMIGYIFGGMIADVFKPKTLLLSSYALNMLVYCFYATLPSYTPLLVAQFLTSLVAYGLFWGAMVKYVRSLGDAANEGRLFGLQFAFVGLGGSILGVLGATFIGQFGTAQGLRYLFIMNAASCGLALLVDAFLYKPREVQISEDDKFKFSLVFEVIRLKQFWAICLMSFSMYSMSIILAYLPPLLTSNYGVAIGLVSLIGTFRMYIVRIVFAPVGGALMDKIGSPIRVICGVLVTTTAMTLLILLAPDNLIAIPIIVIIVLAICYQLGTPGWFTTVSEIKIPNKMKGTAVGILCAVMFAPDAFAYIVIGRWIDKYGEKTGYTMAFSSIAVVMVLGLICGLYALRYMKKCSAAAKP